MTTTGQVPEFESLTCIACGNDTTHYSVVEFESRELIDGLCLDCENPDIYQWKEVSETCVVCDDSPDYALNAVKPHPENPNKSTYAPAANGVLVCDDHLSE
ncbi:hypothetical protein ACFQJC_17275 [Haloferax namakaokahaiae]|uniref:Small CPxCG-related zinc finger protein n=1 Tax=Haloferax namakaokahaiae TaxID=1748331 RepID=A0ABD5ZJL2_9EURY